MIHAYNQVTENLRQSHETLRAEVVRLQGQLASTSAQLQRTKQLAALGEMAAGIAHEIRNPLAAIQLFTGVMLKDLRGESGSGRDFRLAAESAEKISTAVRGLEAIVSDVLSFAKQFKLRPRPVSVSAMLDRALDAHRPAIEGVGVLVRRTGGAVREAGEPMRVDVDPELMHQAVLNLVRNAVESMAEVSGQAKSKARGSAKRVLTLGAWRDGGQVVVTVRDTGPGVAEADIDRIFNPFFTTRSTGTGLGLAIVHRIVDAHGGVIGVHNDGGAVFELRLPEHGGSGKNTGEQAPDGDTDEGE
jgi:two-component system sensor histidine kinase HydH